MNCILNSKRNTAVLIVLGSVKEGTLNALFLCKALGIIQILCLRMILLREELSSI
jgi:hypothetical protein